MKQEIRIAVPINEEDIRLFNEIIENDNTFTWSFPVIEGCQNKDAYVRIHFFKEQEDE